MSEIKVGEYVRTIRGEIAIFKGWNNNSKSQWSCKLEFQKIKTWKYCCEEYIKLHSPNIIDLLEVGDYVNGCQVMGIYIPRDTWEPIEVNVDSQTTKYFIKDEIKTIVTHEQFEKMEYNV